MPAVGAQFIHIPPKPLARWRWALKLLFSETKGKQDSDLSFCNFLFCFTQHRTVKLSEMFQKFLWYGNVNIYTDYSWLYKSQSREKTAAFSILDDRCGLTKWCMMYDVLKVLSYGSWSELFIDMSIYLLNIDSIQGLNLLGSGGWFGFVVSISLKDKWQYETVTSQLICHQCSVTVPFDKQWIL